LSPNLARKKLLVTAPPFVLIKDEIFPRIDQSNLDVTWKSGQQLLEEKQLIELLPHFDGWILGDDPCSREVLETAQKGSLRAVVKWGVGTDNIDFDAINELEIGFRNTPGMFGKEVADLALGYLIMLFRKILETHHGVLEGKWLKPSGNSLENKEVAIIGFGDSGRNLTKRLLACDARVNVYELDNLLTFDQNAIDFLSWPSRIEEMDALVLACPLTETNKGMIDARVLQRMKRNAVIINVSRGKLIKENDLVGALRNATIAGAALDVFEVEPLPLTSGLRECSNVIFGTHNASNTKEAVVRTSLRTLEIIQELLQDKNEMAK